ncbi:hypothetical protein ACFYNY_19875 [Streptomyces sp. NPDC006530]|uniref:hypothetical protein n=1 Tax=Streptomyces sp. NPDC006530 TaxID=3364750 RepID=UPI003696D973
MRGCLCGLFTREVIGVSFAITIAAMFTSYYKFRERSYFLQQTADLIEEEANAVRLGIGANSEYGSGQEDEAPKKFIHLTEEQRNEQRRRQQQLDQPSERATPSSQPQVGLTQGFSHRRRGQHDRGWRRGRRGLRAG